MSKYGRRLAFGYAPAPTVAEPKRPIQLAARAEVLGLDCIGVQDHPRNADYHDAWTLLTAIGMATSCASLFSVAPLKRLRSPLVMAKAVASLDLLTQGRVDFGIGVGKKCDNDTLVAVEEAIAVMRMLWDGGQAVYFDGKFFHLNGEHPVSKPTRPIGIWIDAGDETALDLVGRMADGWFISASAKASREQLAAWSDRVDDIALENGRHPSEIRRILAIGGTIDSDDEGKGSPGSIKQWAETLASLAMEVGIDTFVLVEGAHAEKHLENYAQEVVPYTRELAELAPGVSPASGLSHAYQGAAASGATRAEEATQQVDLVDETSMESFPASDPPASSSFT